MTKEASRRLKIHSRAISEHQCKANGLCPLDNRHFVWGGCLVGDSTVVVRNRSDVVAQSEAEYYILDARGHIPSTTARKLRSG